jgi:NitT/TauT family transport system substrate-binding protein
VKTTLLLALLFALPFAVRAEVSTVTVARQHGIGYLALMIMERDKLIEREAKALGLPDLKVEWAQYAGGNVMNDALLSGRLHFAALGNSAFFTLWSRTRGTPQEVRGVCAFGSFPFYLNTRNPNVRSIRDLTNADRIAVPAVKVSNQALIMQIAAEREFGPGRANDLDKYTVSMSHPDALAAFLSGRSEINGHFTWDPFHSREIAVPGVRTILDSSVVLGVPATTILIAAQRSFHEANPKVNAAFLAAFRAATDLINRDKDEAAQIYLEITRDKNETRASMARMISDPKGEYTVVPKGMMIFASFMKKVGLIKEVPASWKDLYFAPITQEAGS